MTTLTEKFIADRAHDIATALQDTGIDYDVFYDEDGDEGWHITVAAGEERDREGGGTGRDYMISYWTRDNTWYWESVDENGRRVGPWPLAALDSDSTPGQVAAHVRYILGDKAGQR